MNSISKIAIVKVHFTTNIIKGTVVMERCCSLLTVRMSAMWDAMGGAFSNKKIVPRALLTSSKLCDN